MRNKTPTPGLANTSDRTLRICSVYLLCVLYGHFDLQRKLLDQVYNYTAEKKQRITVPMTKMIIFPNIYVTLFD